jgi:hypothetical protein
MYIYSTASSDIKINLFGEVGVGQVPRVVDFVVVNGKANIANQNLVTPKGVATNINEKQAKLLESNKMFQQMVKDGFMVIETKKLEADSVASDMEAKDASAPLEPKDAKIMGVYLSDEK